MNLDYYHFLTLSELHALAEEFSRGPQPAFEGVHPDSTDAERLKIGKKRFDDKFLRNDRCPMGHHPKDFVDHPPIAARLAADGFIISEPQSSSSSIQTRS